MYDYVIAGAGSAGCVLAARLSEDPKVSVALVEAGPRDKGEEFRIPALYPQQFKTSTDWDYAGEPEPALDGRRLYLPRGRVLGGSSSMNSMVYTRGGRADYDRWAELGAAGWDYESVLPYFKRSEDNERGENEFHGVGGELRVSDGRANHLIVDAWIEAAVEAGNVRNKDFNGASQDGVGRYQMTQREGLRDSTARAFLHPAMTRPNLTVLTDTLVTQVLLEGERAVGLQVSHLGESKTIAAEREVILSAGAYGSPQLLMLSGIGPADELKDMLIDPVVDLPEVGRNLNEHPGVFLCYLTTVPSLNGADTAENRELLTREGRGPLTCNIPEGGGYLRTAGAGEAPDLQLFASPVMYHEDGLGVPFADAFTTALYVTKPTSRGSVTLRSKLPNAKPRIFSNLLDTEEDRRTIIEGVRQALEIAEQPSLTKVLRDPKRSAEAGLIPASDSDRDIEAFVTRGTAAIYHASGTCAIGRVVDSELRVLGVDGLRVADASVMPEVVRGTTNPPTIMIGEKAADLVRGRTSAQDASPIRVGA